MWPLFAQATQLVCVRLRRSGMQRPPAAPSFAQHRQHAEFVHRHRCGSTVVPCKYQSAESDSNTLEKLEAPAAHQEVLLS